ncbi:MAG: hypothetical protein V4674_03905 [Patescibacteria group bacterium]
MNGKETAGAEVEAGKIDYRSDAEANYRLMRILEEVMGIGELIVIRHGDDFVNARAISPSDQALLVSTTNGLHTALTKYFGNSERQPVVGVPLDPDVLEQVKIAHASVGEAIDALEKKLLATKLAASLEKEKPGVPVDAPTRIGIEGIVAARLHMLCSAPSGDPARAVEEEKSSS